MARKDPGGIQFYQTTSDSPDTNEGSEATVPADQSQTVKSVAVLAAPNNESFRVRIRAKKVLKKRKLRQSSFRS